MGFILPAKYMPNTHVSKPKNRYLSKLTNNDQKLTVKVRGVCAYSMFKDINENFYHFDGKLGKQILPEIRIPIKFV